MFFMMKLFIQNYISVTKSIIVSDFLRERIRKLQLLKTLSFGKALKLYEV